MLTKQSRFSRALIDQCFAASLAVATGNIIADLEEECTDLLEQHPKLEYDEALFPFVCGNLRCSDDNIKKWMSALSPHSTMEDMLRAIPQPLRVAFLKHYIWKFQQMLVV